MGQIDRNILTELQRDATISVAQLADRVGLSQTPCWKRVQKLEATGVIHDAVVIPASAADITQAAMLKVFWRLTGADGVVEVAGRWTRSASVGGGPYRDSYRDTRGGEASAEALISRLEGAEPDLVVLNVVYDRRGRFTVHELYKERYVVIFPPGHRLASLNAIKLADLSGDARKRLVRVMADQKSRDQERIQAAADLLNIRGGDIRRQARSGSGSGQTYPCRFWRAADR